MKTLALWYFVVTFILSPGVRMVMRVEFEQKALCEKVQADYEDKWAADEVESITICRAVGR